ncbi:MULTISPECIES: type VII secretion target [unclassified Mycobacterium]|uniref:type VII secretion target n=1 Tax=unclassified Mycobacterium TaxID=2642494 RepID=UPI0007404721|nr:MULTISPECIES: type VII secretion target [unclassified Mycobacterium]KUH82061.1 hypothetical protein AU187_18055 [Mycobacterium sp. IS-1556]KUH87839.1 hypothetical protein AU185_07940 [Mycobacterium sp. GA-0227b]KUH88594.1 hypothetical protein AU186_09890 [Mycobacterium sp. GA-1999]
MEVDPEILKAFAGQVDTASSLIREADVGNKVSDAADGLPGSTTQWAARLVGGHVTERADAIAANVSRIGAAVRGAGNTYEVTDSDLAGNFKGIF